MSILNFNVILVRILVRVLVRPGLACGPGERRKMRKLISCEFNIDTACVELRYADGGPSASTRQALMTA